MEAILNDKKKPQFHGLFGSVGKFPFEKDQSGVVTISTRGTSDYVVIDAVRLVELDANGKPIIDESAADAEALAQARKDLESSTSLLTSLEKEQKELEANAPPPIPKAFAVAEAKEIGDCEIRIRGEHRNRGEQIPRGFLQVAWNGEDPGISATSSGRI